MRERVRRIVALLSAGGRFEFATSPIRIRLICVLVSPALVALSACSKSHDQSTTDSQFDATQTVDTEVSGTPSPAVGQANPSASAGADAQSEAPAKPQGANTTEGTVQRVATAQQRAPRETSEPGGTGHQDTEDGGGTPGTATLPQRGRGKKKLPNARKRVCPWVTKISAARSA
jgi:hypothetical protein